MVLQDHNDPFDTETFGARELREEIMPWVELKGNPEKRAQGVDKAKKVVLVSGDEEYRSEEALPMLAKILSEQHGFDCVVLFAINPETVTVDPNYGRNIPGLHHLDDADAMVIFTRFRDLPVWQMKHIDAFCKRGGSIIGLRTATHAFNTGGKDNPYAKWSFNNQEWKVDLVSRF